MMVWGWLGLGGGGFRQIPPPPGISARHATSVPQGNWFSVAIGPVSKAY